jgi:hypothetical protein
VVFRILHGEIVLVQQDYLRELVWMLLDLDHLQLPGQDWQWRLKELVLVQAYRSP